MNTLRNPEWGLPPRGPFSIAWGARAIYQPDFSTPKPKTRKKGAKAPVPNLFDLLWDRQEMVGGSEEERKAFGKSLDERALPLLREAVFKARLSTSDDETIAVEIDGIVVIASPRRSYGYLYIGAWRPAVEPSAAASADNAHEEPPATERSS